MFIYRGICFIDKLHYRFINMPTEIVWPAHMWPLAYSLRILAFGYVISAYLMCPTITPRRWCTAAVYITGKNNIVTGISVGNLKVEYSCWGETVKTHNRCCDNNTIFKLSYLLRAAIIEIFFICLADNCPIMELNESCSHAWRQLRHCLEKGDYFRSSPEDISVQIVISTGIWWVRLSMLLFVPNNVFS